MSFGQRNLDREKPEIDFPEGDVPTELVITDLIEGDGAEAKPGDTVSTHYVGVAWSTGEEFDASWGRGAVPFDQVGDDQFGGDVSFGEVNFRLLAVEVALSK